MSEWRTVAEGLRFPEGLNCGPDGDWWFTDVEMGALFRVKRTGQMKKTPIGDRLSGAAIGPDGRIWLCDQANGIWCFDPETEEPCLILSTSDFPDLDHPNDIVIHPNGDIAFSCHANARTVAKGSVWAYRVGQSPVCLLRDLLFPNGLAFSPDGRKLYIAETYGGRLHCGDYSSRGPALENVSVLAATVSPTGPDGISVMQTGMILAAIFGAGVIQLFHPSGHEMGTIAVPGERPTSVCLSTDGNEIAVTDASSGKVFSKDWVGCEIGN